MSLIFNLIRLTENSYAMCACVCEILESWEVVTMDLCQYKKYRRGAINLLAKLLPGL